jgi:hypothetical protein
MGNAEERPITNSKNGGFGSYRVPFFYLKPFFRLGKNLTKHNKKAQELGKFSGLIGFQPTRQCRLTKLNAYANYNFKGNIQKGYSPKGQKG